MPCEIKGTTSKLAMRLMLLFVGGISFLLVIPVMAEMPQPPGMYSHVETMFLRSGVDGFPDNGNVLRGIGKTGSSFGGDVYFDTLTAFGAPGQRNPYLRSEWDVGTTWGEGKLLWRADLADIPDSAVIVRARLFLRPYDSSPLHNSEINAFRLMLDWDENEINWGDRFADSTWSAAGASDSLGVYYCGDCPVPDNYNILGQLNRSSMVSTHTTMGPFLDDIYLDIQADNIYSSYELVTEMDYVDEPVGMTTIARANANMGDDTSEQGWVLVDVTHPVRMWHYNVWANYGLMFRITDPSMDEKVEFSSDTNATIENRPLLVIEYLYVTEDVTTIGDRRRKITPWRM